LVVEELGAQVGEASDLLVAGAVVLVQGKAENLGPEGGEGEHLRSRSSF
jgi:hypothetical protein